MAIKTLLRVLSRLYIKVELRNGLFLLQLVDFHASNIPVVKHWNVTGLIDLEWICALPSEMLGVSCWLTGCAIDQLRGEKLDRFDDVRREFMRAFEDKEQAMKTKTRHNITLPTVMKYMWRSKGVWFWRCLSSLNANFYLPKTHLYHSYPSKPRCFCQGCGAGTRSMLFKRI